MIRKLLLIAAIAAGMTFAQSESTQSYTAAQPKTERPETAQAAPEADPAWNVSIHPASLVVFSALGLRSLYVDVERSTSAHTSITVTPNVVYFNSDYYDIDDDASFSALVFGLAGGFRFYLNPGHNGLYFEAQLQYAHTGITYDDEEKFGSASSNTFGPYALAGWKFVNGRLTLALDAGVGFNIVSASSEDGSVKRTATDIEKDTELFKASGFSTDINLTLGIAF
ncbi:hypothetical protein [Fibrobacter succinogenes]|uniref:hypothetical protein n=1 Tax=Fibrobacter succinogenes TaxID=833 RepID=UPI0015667FD6|nr:hypothetical protein [Fibrobacter succinogenes]